MGDLIQTDLAGTWTDVFTTRDRRPIPDWAHDFIWLSPPITKTGWFDISGSRHFIPIFASLQNDRKRETNVLKPVRGGGSLIGDIYCPWTIVNDPGPYMDVFQTDKVAGDHAEERIKRIFESCAPVRKLFPSNRHKQRDNEILFSNGHTWYVRGPSLANLQAKGIRYLRLEEVWMWDQGKMGEAEGRIGDYLKMQTSKILRVSQGGPKDGVEMEESDWFQAYYKGKIFEWEVQCLNTDCGKYFDPIFSGQRADGSFWGINWNKYQLSNGDWDVAKCVPTVRFECPHCSHPMLDNPRTKGEWNRTGRYRDTQPEREESKKDSFHWESVIDFPWDELAELWLNACNAEKRGDLKPKLQFYQKRRAIFKDEQSLLKGGLHLTRVAYAIQTEMPGEKLRGMQIDRQEEDLFWWSARAWLVIGGVVKTRRLGFGKAYGFAELEKIRNELKIPPNRTFCDSAYLPKGDHGVYAACLKYGWIAVRGDDKHFFIHRIKRGTQVRHVQKSYAPLTYGDPDMGAAGQNRRHCPLIIFSKPAMNQKVQELIDHGHWEEPATGDPEIEKEYALQMSSRVKKSEFNPKTGQTKVWWKESKNDHARDLANQATLVGILGEVCPDPAAEQLSEREKEEMAK
ncbi:MAG TPA: phage terminase large subunit family protein [Verrucomicrobiae bacterium]|jgi:hypothetical protein|nr:phage terminase large subunit family protein [Verrucomicrobiae bacterium]